jgi:predicted CXXCH cytochrome family protein
MLNNVTCVTCHDIHTGGDEVLFPAQQAKICTICHKAQKAGVHGKEEFADFNPACSSCHNPHDHESAESEMLRNGSMGCRGCHDLERMATSDKVSGTSKRYHRVMRQPHHTCVECHEGVAHVSPDAVTAFIPTPASSKRVTLFYPGRADSTWLLHDHPGSQPLRQGTHCRQCHRGEEANMGRSRAEIDGFEPASRVMKVSFDLDEDSIRMVLQWRGKRDESDLALMWGTERSGSAFTRGACFAACHSDLPGMALDRGQGTDKYLWDARGQLQSPGGASAIGDEASLEQMLAEGRYAVLWRIYLNSGAVKAATLLDKLRWQPAAPIRASTSYENGLWTVKIRRKINHLPEHLTEFNPAETYTLGIALHGVDNPGAGHWVSLPLSFSYHGEDTDFRLE